MKDISNFEFNHKLGEKFKTSKLTKDLLGEEVELVALSYTIRGRKA